jgi:hypothetical protein
VFFIENDKGPKYPNAWDRCWSGFCSQAEISCQEIPGCKPPAFLILSYDKVCAMPVGRFKDSSSTNPYKQGSSMSLCLFRHASSPLPTGPWGPRLACHVHRVGRYHLWGSVLRCQPPGQFVSRNTDAASHLVQPENAGHDSRKLAMLASFNLISHISLGEYLPNSLGYGGYGVRVQFLSPGTSHGGLGQQLRYPEVAEDGALTGHQDVLWLPLRRQTWGTWGMSRFSEDSCK